MRFTLWRPSMRWIVREDEPSEEMLAAIEKLKASLPTVTEVPHLMRLSPERLAIIKELREECVPMICSTSTTVSMPAKTCTGSMVKWAQRYADLMNIEVCCSTHHQNGGQTAIWLEPRAWAVERRQREEKYLRKIKESLRGVRP